MPQDFQPTDVQQELVTLATNVDLIRRFRYVDADVDVLARELVPAVEMVTSELVGVFDRIQGKYQTGEGAGAGGESGPVSDAEMLADLCLMSRQEVEDRVARLREQVRGADGMETITRSMALLGTLRRSAVAVENSLAEQATLDRRLSSRSELDLALALRGAYSALRRTLGDKPPAVTELQGRLRGAGEVLGQLLARDVYWELRAADRAALHGLHRRLLLWLGGGDDHDSASGRYLWGDLKRFVDGLGQVNERGDVIDHDRGVIRAVHSNLNARGRPPEQLPPALLRQLRRLAGRDAEVDRLLGEEVVQTSAWMAAIDRLREGL